MDLLEDVKRILSIRIKARHDSIYDQYSRLFMPKILLMCSIAVGINWYQDKLRCITTDSIEFTHDFISDACWINGFYIYDDLSADESSYYGIPRKIAFDGKYKNGKLCSTFDPSSKKFDENCVLMEKVFFLQYQWYPFFIASLMLLFYVPHLFFRLINEDMISLTNAVKHNTCDEIVNTYFDFKINGITRMRTKIICNIAVKLTYVFSNIMTFLLIDYSLNEKYIGYAKSWFDWSTQNNTAMFEYTDRHGMFRAGEILLPSFGLCNLQEGWHDNHKLVNNRHKLICEFSAHVLYHYVLIVLWFFIVFGICISSAGLIMHVGNYLFVLLPLAQEKSKIGHLYKTLTLREREYLEFVRSQNIALYGMLLNKLREYRFGEPSSCESSVDTLRKKIKEMANQLDYLQPISDEIGYENDCLH